MENQKYTYMTILCDDGYLKGVIGLKRSLQKAGCSYNLVTLVSPQVSKLNLDILRKEEIDTVCCPEIDITANYDNEEFNYWKKTFFKFRIFEMTEYDKIVYLDSDMLIRKNIDHLFELDGFSAVSDVEFCYNNPNAFGINSGMMVFKPEEQIIDKLTEICVEYEKKYEKPFGDQEIINEYLKENGADINYLSVKYNANYRQLHNYSMKDYSVIHFVLQPKPWNENKMVLLMKAMRHRINGRKESAEILMDAFRVY